MSLPALYIGRFQPFHLGHLDAIKQILEKESHVIIAVGSSQYSGTEMNPHKYELRKKIIELSLAQEKIPSRKYTVLPLKDIHDNAGWCDYIDETLPTYGAVYTGSPFTKALYSEQNKHIVGDLEMRLEVSSTLVRDTIKRQKDWQDLVPKACYDMVKKISKVTI